MTRRRFLQVDVFTSRPFLGNPVAVVVDAEGLDTVAMQAIARWTNLSETTFLLPPTTPEADYRVRIFSPRTELPFAGHPSLGSAWAALEAGVVPSRPRLIQECAAGLLPIEVEGTGSGRTLSVLTPSATITEVTAVEFSALEEVLGCGWLDEPVPSIVALGPRWLVVRLADRRALSRLVPAGDALVALSQRLRVTGLVAYALNDAGAPEAMAVRAFAPAEGVAEDPVCGSGNAAIGAVVAAGRGLSHLLPGWTATQGRELGRDGRVAVRVIDGRVLVGGQCVTVVDGSLTTPDANQVLP
jgi:PhzF family phenazine biosynthesis protein